METYAYRYRKKIKLRYNIFVNKRTLLRQTVQALRINYERHPCDT